MPYGWARFALPVNAAWADAMNVWKQWPVWYHPVLHGHSVPHFVETMQILKQGDIGPFAEGLHVAHGRMATPAAAHGSGIHFMRSIRFAEALEQGYGDAYSDLNLAVMARVHPKEDEVK